MVSASQLVKTLSTSD